MIAQACSGLMSITGEPDGKPAKPGATLGDSGTGMLMCISILAALHKRKETGKGVHLQVAMQDALLHYIRNSFCLTTKTGKPAPRAGAKNARSHQSALRHLPLRAGRTERLRLRLHEPRQSRALAAAAQSDRARGPDRRSALRDARGAGRELGGNRPDHHRVHEQARQVRVHARDRRRRSVRGRARHARDPERCQFPGAGHHSEDRAPAPRHVQDGRLAGALQRHSSPR